MYICYIFLEDDFDINAIVVVFNPGETEHSIFIPIRNDLVLEQDEIFDVVLTNINGTNAGVEIGMPRTAEVSIMNSNSKCFV